MLLLLLVVQFGQSLPLRSYDHKKHPNYYTKQSKHSCSDHLFSVSLLKHMYTSVLLEYHVKGDNMHIEILVLELHYLAACTCNIPIPSKEVDLTRPNGISFQRSMMLIRIKVDCICAHIL